MSKSMYGFIIFKDKVQQSSSNKACIINRYFYSNVEKLGITKIVHNHKKEKGYC